MTDFARYLNIRSAQMPVLSPDGSRVAFLSDSSGNLQVWSASTAPDSREWPRQLTFFADKMWEVHGTGGADHLLAVGDVGGNERQQFYLISGYGGDGGHDVRRLTVDDNAIHRFGGFSGDGQRILYAANGRNGVDFDLFQMDVTNGESRLLCELSGNQEVMAWSPDEQFVLTRQQMGPLEDRLFLIDLQAEGGPIQPHAVTVNVSPARYEQVHWQSSGVYLLSDRTHDRGALCRLDVTCGELTEIVNADAIRARARWKRWRWRPTARRSTLTMRAATVVCGGWTWRRVRGPKLPVSRTVRSVIFPSKSMERWSVMYRHPRPI